jgi:hypothetical protein
MRTTKGGPHGHVHRARNFISESGRPCVFHAARKRHDAIPIDNHAIYTHATQHASTARRKRASVKSNRWMGWRPRVEKRQLYLVRHADEIL